MATIGAGARKVATRSSFALAAVAAAWLCAAGPTRAADGDEMAVDLELVLAVDVSGSVDPEEAKLQRTGYVAALRDRQVLAAIGSGMLRRIAVAYVEWADAERQAVVLGWSLIDGPESAEALAGRLEELPVQRGRFTSISGAIDFVLPMFDGNGFRGTRRVIDVSGDGVNNSGRRVTDARAAAVDAGVTVNGLPIMHPPGRGSGVQVADLDKYYESCVIGGAGAFIVAAESFESFAVAVRKKLVLEIAGSGRDHSLLRPAAAAGSAEDTRAFDCEAGERRFDGRQPGHHRSGN